MPTPRQGFLSGPVTDSVFLILAPLMGAGLFLLFRLNPFLFYPLPEPSFLRGRELVSNFSFMVIYAHLFIVFFRSHANPNIFSLHKLRFTLAPALLFAAVFLSKKALAFTGILAIYWDVYHSSLQTFGIGRIYDRLQGNDPRVGRRLDWILNLLVYAGPVLGGVVLTDHFMLHHQYTAVFPTFETLLFQLPPRQHELRFALIGLGLPFCAYYLYAYWRLSRQGYRVSRQKVALFVTTAVVSIVCWGFNPFGSAFFIMNFFHAFQYFFLVWFVEQRHITSLFRVSNLPHGPSLALFLFVLIGISYGVWSQLRSPFDVPEHAKICVLLVISILHFWYDGFIWSVRKGQV